MKTLILFSVEVPLAAAKNDILLKCGNNSYKMVQIPSQIKQQKNTFFQFKLEFPPSNNYPIFISYAYSIDNFKQRVIFINYQPNSMLVINDTMQINNGIKPFFHTVLFYLRINANAKNHVILVSPNPIFWDGSQFTDKCVMNFSNDTTFWCKVNVPSNALGAITYKYQVVAPNQIIEQGRSHTLVIRSPIGGKVVSVYDTFQSAMPTNILPYYPRPIFPADSKPFNTTVQLEYTDNKPSNSVFFSMNRGKAELMERDVGWHFYKIYPKFNSETKISFGVSSVTGKGTTDWDKNVATVYPTSAKLDTIAIRNLKEAPLSKSFGIYVDLVSLPAQKGSLCGDFTSLHTLIEFCKKSGIAHIHVGIDRINDNRLIDPVLSSVKYQSTQDMQLSEIRDAKIEALQKEFESWQTRQSQDARFSEFLRIFGMFLKPLCPDQFSLYVQYTLFSELDEAFVHATRLGISLIIDANIDNCEGALDQQIQLFAPFAQYVKVNNSSIVLATATLDDVREIFGDLSENVLKICYTIGTAVLIKPAFIAEQCNIAAVDASGIPEELSETFCAKLSKLRKLIISEERIQRRDNYIKFFKTLSNIAPSAIMLDAAASSLVSEDDLSDSSIICCSDRAFYEPSYLSPEVISEFPEESKKEDVLNKITSKLNSNIFGMTCYLSDLLMALSHGSLTCKCIQNIPDHTRVVFDTSSEDLIQNGDIIVSIRDFLKQYNCIAI